MLCLRNVYLFLEDVLLEGLPLFLLCVLGVLRCLRSARHALASLRRLRTTLHHDLATLGLAAMLTLFNLYRLSICQVCLARQLVQIQVRLRRRLLCALRRVLLLVHKILEFLLVQCLLMLFLFNGFLNGVLISEHLLVQRL